ncbi:MurT ligase domain-containing protein [Rhodococcus sp. X156]|uniref:MurT ligase domain-containing protein n=1 Tax=Rhodococcus sp. X156 TaxID=2499145 RepID=UPI0019CF5276|nr:MurT ligase domain-containing protein [Rhodococcus sp. X156]
MTTAPLPDAPLQPPVGPLAAAPSAPRLPLRTALAVRAGRATAWLSRRTGRGAGRIIGGRVTLALEPDALRKLTAGRQVVLVTGTNGKTTTTAMTASVLRQLADVATNDDGANMPDGLVAALCAAPRAPFAVLEVDEPYVPAVIDATDPAVLVLLNFSRDQLDRVGEVSHLDARLREALGRHPACTVVANADDPVVVSSAGSANPAEWVSGDALWLHDSTTCPRCARVLVRDGRHWACECGLRRPEAGWTVTDTELLRGGAVLPLSVSLPGRFNRFNAVTAIAAANTLGADLDAAVALMGQMGAVSGRYSTVTLQGRELRFLLSKNPAGATETLHMLSATDTPVVVAINGREADGRDLSWLWDVPFEELTGRTVIATGERCQDLSVRLSYAGVQHETVPVPRQALLHAPEGTVDVFANYTAFRELIAEVTPSA